MEYRKNYKYFENKDYRNSYNRNNFRVRGLIKTFRDLEVYRTTIKLSNILLNLDFLKEEKDEIKRISERIPELIAESYGNKFDLIELAEKKLEEAMTLITNIITKIDLFREKFCEDKEKKEILDGVLIKYSYQRRKILNLKKAWGKIFGRNLDEKNKLNKSIEK